jgi:hypothetical protein
MAEELLGRSESYQGYAIENIADREADVFLRCVLIVKTASFWDERLRQ